MLDQTNPTKDDTKQSEPETKISSTCWSIVTEHHLNNSKTHKYFDDSIREQTQNTSIKVLVKIVQTWTVVIWLSTSYLYEEFVGQALSLNKGSKDRLCSTMLFLTWSYHNIILQIKVFKDCIQHQNVNYWNVFSLGSLWS